MTGRTLVLALLPLALAATTPGEPAMAQHVASSDPSMAALWEPPDDLSSRDLYNGQWSPEHAPTPGAVYTYVRAKQGGTNPGLIVRDPAGREWHVKQPPHNKAQGDEGPVEVAMSRVLSALGYHQPPVYYVPSFELRDGDGTRRVPGGRFRLADPSMKGRGNWSWQSSPFVGTRPYEGLLVILMAFNSADLKNSNNTIYDVRGADGVRHPWYVVRDLGSSLGESGHFTPTRNDPDKFERELFITGVHDGFVSFSFHGWHQELLHHRITPADAGWAAALLGRLSDQQWADAFRAGGYTPAVTDRYVRKLHANIARAQQIADDASRASSDSR